MEIPRQHAAPPPPYEDLSQVSGEYGSQQNMHLTQYHQPPYTAYAPHACSRSSQIPPDLLQPQQWPIPSHVTQYISSQQNIRHEIHDEASRGPSSNHYHQPSLQPSTQRQSLKARPCVIPQITKVFGGAFMSPFTRTRVPELEQIYGLSSSKLLSFIDGLNESFMANPALHVTNTIGTIVGFAPLHTAQIVGTSLNVAAGLGTAAVSIIRTKRYMKQANQTIFKPRGLHAQICKTEEMLSQIGMRYDTAVFVKGQVQAMLGSAQANEPSRHAIARRMEALGDRVMALSFDNVEAIVSPDTWAKKIGTFAAQRAEKKQLEKLGKQQAKAEERAAKVERQSDRAVRKHNRTGEKIGEIMKEMEDVQFQIQSLDPNHRRYVKHLRELQREYGELERKLSRVEDKGKSRDAQRTDKRDRKRDAKTATCEDKEAKKINKIYWIVIAADDQTALGDDDLASDNSSEVSAQY